LVRELYKTTLGAIYSTAGDKFLLVRVDEHELWFSDFGSAYFELTAEIWKEH